MWTIPNSQYMMQDIFMDFYESLGSNLSIEDFFAVKVDIKNDQKGYEKLRQLAVKFFDDNFMQYIKLGYHGLKSYNATLDMIENFMRVLNKFGGHHLNLLGGDTGVIFTQLIVYKQPLDIKYIGDLEKLKKISDGKTVYTVGDIFDYLQFEFKAFLVCDDEPFKPTYESLIQAVLYLFDYNQAKVQPSERKLLTAIVERWEEETEDDLLIYPYAEFKNLIFEATSKGKGASSPLRSIFRTIINVVRWITNEKRFTNREIAIRTFMRIMRKKLQ